MAIDFGPDRWARVRSAYDAWWRGDLDRPLIELVVWNREPQREMPAAPLLDQSTCADFSIPVEALVDRLDWELERCTFLGDSFPMVNMHSFGPGVAAAFSGAILDNSSGAVWFYPPQGDMPIGDIHLEYDPENRWARRIKEFCSAAMDRWQGQVLVGMTDLGGVMDIVSTFLPSDRLLLELYDNPNEVKRLVGEAHTLWHAAYRDIHSVLQPVNPGYSDWSGIYSDRPSYILQCDFSYMIGPSMFDEFVLPELACSASLIDRPFYHLDGAGQLPHLDSLLGIERLAGIQWVPGDGAPGPTEWPEVRRKIAASGKRAQTFGSLSDLAAIVGQVGSGKGIHHRANAAGLPTDVSTIRRAVAIFGA